jgi:hypothetical protein
MDDTLFIKPARNNAVIMATNILTTIKLDIRLTILTPPLYHSIYLMCSNELGNSG